MRRYTIIGLTLCISGCYENWPALDKVSEMITCEMQVSELDALAKKYDARGEFDELSSSYSMTKFDDGIGVAFNAKGEMMTIAKTKSLIGVAGMTRRQGDVIIVKRCIKQ